MENIFKKLEKNLIRINFDAKDEIELYISYFEDEEIDGFFESSKLLRYENTGKKYVRDNRSFIIYRLTLLNINLFDFLESFYVLIKTLDEKNQKLNDIKILFDKQKMDLLKQQEEMMKKINSEFFSKIKDIIISPETPKEDVVETEEDIKEKQDQENIE